MAGVAEAATAPPAAAVASGAPQEPQNRNDASLAVPQVAQTTASAAPHWPQNRCPGVLAAPQTWQVSSTATNSSDTKTGTRHRR